MDRETLTRYHGRRLRPQSPFKHELMIAAGGWVYNLTRECPSSFCCPKENPSIRHILIRPGKTRPLGLTFSIFGSTLLTLARARVALWPQCAAAYEHAHQPLRRQMEYHAGTNLDDAGPIVPADLYRLLVTASRHRIVARFSADGMNPAPTMPAPFWRNPTTLYNGELAFGGSVLLVRRWRG